MTGLDHRLDCEALLLQFEHPPLDALALTQGRAVHFAEEIFIRIGHLLEQKNGSPQRLLDFDFLCIEETGQRIAVIYLAAIEEMATRSFPLESKDSRAIGT
jgi:hypothetical protein